MSEYSIYVRLPRIAGRWLKHRYGDPVRFPRRSPENVVVVDALRVPRGDETPCVGGDGLTAIAIPWNDARPASRWHSVTAAGERAIREAVDHLFVREMYRGLLPLVWGGAAWRGSSGHGGRGEAGLLEGITHWCLANGLAEDDVEAVRQRFYRLRRRK